MKTALRSVLAVVGGFAIMTVLIFALTIVAAMAFDVVRRDPTPGYVAASIALSAFSSFVGGYATVALAAGRPFAHTLALAVIVLALGVYSVLSPQPGQPQWYLITLAVMGPAFVLAGGHVRNKRSSPKN